MAIYRVCIKTESTRTFCIEARNRKDVIKEGLALKNEKVLDFIPDNYKETVTADHIETNG